MIRPIFNSRFVQCFVVIALQNYTNFSFYSTGSGARQEESLRCEIATRYRHTPSRRVQDVVLLSDISDEPGVPVRLGYRRRSDRRRQRVQRQVPGLLLHALQLGRARERHEVETDGVVAGARRHRCSKKKKHHVTSINVLVDMYSDWHDLFMLIFCFLLSSTRSSIQMSRHDD